MIFRSLVTALSLLVGLLVLNPTTRTSAMTLSNAETVAAARSDLAEVVAYRGGHRGGWGRGHHRGGWGRGYGYRGAYYRGGWGRGYGYRRAHYRGGYYGYRRYGWNRRYHHHHGSYGWPLGLGLAGTYAAGGWCY